MKKTKKQEPIKPRPVARFEMGSQLGDTQEVSQAMILGIMTIEIDAIVKRLEKAGLLEKKEFKDEIQSKVTELLRTGITSHSLTGEDVPPEMVDKVVKQVKEKLSSSDLKHVG